MARTIYIIRSTRMAIVYWFTGRIRNANDKFCGEGGIFLSPMFKFVYATHYRNCNLKK